MTARLNRSLVGALRELARVRRLLVALDFDGTLAPEVDDPDQARATPAARAAVLRLLAAPGTRVALVSGRGLDDLVAVSELPDDTLLVGSHGAELRLDDPDSAFALDAAERARVAALGEALTGVVDGFDEVWLETKPAGFVVHTRLATESDGRRAYLEALDAAGEHLDALTVRTGKNMLEFSVRTSNKGEAIEHLRRYTGADAVFFAGDDVTDEDAFEALEAHDLGLKSGEGDTAAAFRVGGPDEVALVLETLATFREGDVHEQ